MEFLSIGVFPIVFSSFSMFSNRDDQESMEIAWFLGPRMVQKYFRRLFCGISSVFRLFRPKSARFG